MWVLSVGIGSKSIRCELWNERVNTRLSCSRSASFTNVLSLAYSSPFMLSMLLLKPNALERPSSSTHNEV